MCSGKDDLVLGDDHDAGYIVSYGDALYRALDAARQLRLQGLKVGLVTLVQHVGAWERERELAWCSATT